jgi:hypothetical protein
VFPALCARKSHDQYATSISTGNVNTEHILFVASGAFTAVKPSDLLAELQGRLPIRVTLEGRFAVSCFFFAASVGFVCFVVVLA